MKVSFLHKSLTGLVAMTLLGATAFSAAAVTNTAATNAIAAADGTPWGTPQLINAGIAGGVFGITVSATADINGDGYDDIVGSAGVGGATGPYTGSEVLVYYGSPDGPQLPGQQVVEEGTTGYQGFGNWVASAGDVNGDGYDDILIYAQGEATVIDGIETFRGSVYLYPGSVQGLSPTASAHLVGDDVDGASFGFHCRYAGDVNGDGYDDVIIGGAGAQVNGTAFVYYGAASGLDEASKTRLTGAAHSAYGLDVNAAGDVNGDGYADVVVGASLDPGESTVGAAFVYLGSAEGIDPEAAAILHGDMPHVDFGVAAAGVGDLDGDGYDDVMVTAACEGGDCGLPFSGRGAVFVFNGSAIGVSTPATAKLQLDPAPEAAAQFGWDIEPAGDLNGDGYADVLIGAYVYDTTGAVFVYHGPLTSASQPVTTLPGPAGDHAYSLFGFRFSLGDVNGDGRLDPVVGAPLYDSPEAPGGAIFYYPSVTPDAIFDNGFDPTPPR